jgi:hypothetical protein
MLVLISPIWASSVALPWLWEIVNGRTSLLYDSLAVVRQQTHLMQQCLETPGKLTDALSFSSTLALEFFLNKLEVIIKVFSDGYHLHTLYLFLSATARLN